ncbi:hypothetical protein ACFQX4_24570 [Roseomonas sp. GCM10028921]
MLIFRGSGQMTIGIKPHSVEQGEPSHSTSSPPRRPVRLANAVEGGSTVMSSITPVADWAELHGSICPGADGRLLSDKREDLPFSSLFSARFATLS